MISNNLSAALLKALDRSVGLLLCISFLPIRILGRKLTTKKKEEKAYSFLIIKLWALGDSVYILPLLKALKLHFPQSRVSILVTQQNSEIFKGYIYVDEIIELKTNSITNLLKTIIKIIITSKKRFDISCGFDSDKTGDSTANRMIHLYPAVKRLRPNKHDWNEVLRSKSVLH